MKLYEKIPMSIIWVMLAFSQIMAMISDRLYGILSLSFIWILLYGVPLYLHMRTKQLEFELEQSLKLQEELTSKMWAFLTSEPDPEADKIFRRIRENRK